MDASSSAYDATRTCRYCSVAQSQILPDTYLEARPLKARQRFHLHAAKVRDAGCATASTAQWLTNVRQLRTPLVLA